MENSPTEMTRGETAQIRHDLKTPLNHILGYSEMLEEAAAEAGHREFLPDLKRIQEAARALAGQIERLLSPAAGQTVPPLVRFHHELAESESDEPVFQGRPFIPGHLLVVDDNEANRDLLGRRLARQGYSYALAENGRAGLERIRAESFDLVLLDIMMPELDGFAVLERLKADENLRHIPVIMISSLDELHSVARCIACGAEDYLPKPFNPTLLRARIGACLEKKQLRDQERRTYLALVESQNRLAAELAEASAYVKSILPAPLADGEILTDWHYQPSTQLGGDAFGYHWLDDSHSAMFLLDVSGHGVGAALLSVSAVNVLRSQTLPVDFRDPAAVLTAMNKAFQMDSQNNMFFSLWYGVYDRRNRELRFADAGHPPGALFPPRGAGAGGPIQLRAPGMVIGCFPDQVYSAPSVEAPHGGRLYLFSDGAYELTPPGGGVWGVDAFLQEVENAQALASGRVEAVVARLRAFRGGGEMEDDLSILEVTLV